MSHGMSSARRARDDDDLKAPSGTRAPKGSGRSVKLICSTTAASSMRVEKSARVLVAAAVDTTTLPRVIATWHRLGKGKYVSARPVAARGLPG